MNSRFLPPILFIVLLLLLSACGKWPVFNAKTHVSVCNAAQDNTCNWMSDLLAAHPDQKIALVNICLPASHDAGLYVQQHCTAFANKGNTQTQYLPMKQQLEAGLRLFDIRPSYWHNEFYTQHATGCDGLGCKGDDLKNMLQATADFLATHPELVILNFSHYCHTSASDTLLLSLLNNVLGLYIYKQPITTTQPLIRLPLNDIIPTGSKTGKVILLLEDAGNTDANKVRGLFSDAVWPRTGGWTDDNHYPLLLKHQLNNFNHYEGNGTALYELAWQITQHDGEAVRSALSAYARVSIVHGALYANEQLPMVLDSLIKCGTIHKGKIPNILWSDFADTLVTHQCMKLNRVGFGL